MEGWRCDECKSIVKGSFKQSKIVNLPKYLVIVANRLKIKNWVPEKTECHIRGVDSEEPLCLEQFCGLKSTSTPINTKIEADPVLMEELLMMGIEENPARKALIACNNSSVDAAMSIIFEGGLANEESDTSNSPSYSSEAVDTLVSAGFSEFKAKEALDATDGDLERAFDWIFSHPDESQPPKFTDQAKNDFINFDSKYILNSFITHKGTSVFCGHYVAHLKDDQSGKWILYNDEKVAEAVIDDSFPIEDAYLYFFKKI